MKIEEVEGGYYLRFGKRSCFKPSSCKVCPLFEKLKIEPDHSEFKSVLFIGEGPAVEEGLRMITFIGPAGQVIRETAIDTGADKFGFGYTNIILCQGGKDLEFNAPDELWKAIDLCTETFLWDEIEALKPRVVVPAGNFPKSVILPGERKGIGFIAGLLYSGKDWDYKFDTIPVHHPAHILRNPKMFEAFWDEVNEVRLYFTQKPGPFKTEMGNLETFKLLWDCNDVITVDTETTSFSPHDTGSFMARGKQFNWGDILCMSLCGDGLNSYIFTPDMVREFYREIKELLDARGANCHNGPFDIPFLMKYDLLPELKDDTMLMSYAMDESPRHPLKRLSRRHLGLEDWSEDLDQYLPTRNTSYAFIPEEKLYPYCGMDTGSCGTLRPYLLNKMDENETRLYRDVLMPCANMAIGLSYRGMRVDLLRLMHLKSKWMKEKHELFLKLRGFGINNPNSPFQVSDALNRYGVVDYEAVTVKANLADLGKQCKLDGNEKGLELCTTVVLYREVVKAIDTVLMDVAKSTCGDGRLHPDFKYFATVTGRLVIANPGLLNYPKATRFSDKLREVIIPDPGFVWGHRDQKQFELRVYCVVNDDKTMKVIFANDRDPHGEVLIKHIGIEKYKNLSKKVLEKRRGGIKAVVFGVLYGRGDESVASQLDIPIEEARDIRLTIEAMWEGLGRYRTRTEWELNEYQELVNPLGRKRRFPILTPENYHDSLLQAYNYPIQSTANDLNLLGMYEMWKSPYPEDLFPFFPIHDAIEYQARESRLDEIEDWITEVLSDVPRSVLKVNDVKFVTDGGLGYSWAEASLEGYHKQ